MPLERNATHLTNDKERGLLQDKISGYIPTGLNDAKYGAFTNIVFEAVDAERLQFYGITCTTRT